MGTTIYFGSAESRRQIEETRDAFEARSRTRKWPVSSGATCEIPRSRPIRITTLARISPGRPITWERRSRQTSSSRSNHKNNGGFRAINFGKTTDLVYDQLTSDHPIDLCRYQVANCYMGRVGLINSGGASAGDSDLAQAVRTAVINKRAGRHGP